MSGGFIVSGVTTCPVDGLTVRTFAEDGVTATRASSAV